MCFWNYQEEEYCDHSLPLDATFKICKPLDKVATVNDLQDQEKSTIMSFESVNLPNHFLKYVDDKQVVVEELKQDRDISLSTWIFKPENRNSIKQGL